jgi:hypothetical protein
MVADEPVGAHLRKILAALKALKVRQRRQERLRLDRSLDSVAEVNREDALPNGIGDVKRPA